MEAGAYHASAWSIIITPLCISWGCAIWAMTCQRRRPVATDLCRTSPDVAHRIVARARRLTRTLILLVVALLAIMAAIPLTRWLSLGFVGFVAVAIPMWWRASQVNAWLDAPDAVCLLGRNHVIVTRGSQTRWLYIRSDIVARGAAATIPSARIASR
jgi:hypothetical protein